MKQSETGRQRPIHVLYVDDDEHLLDLTQRFLEQRADGISVTTTTEPREVLSLLEAESFDAVVSDYQMPGMDGLELLEAVRERSDVPFVVFTGQGREEVAIEALNLGADRYLQKGGDPTSQYGVLAQAIEQEVTHHRTRHRLREREQHFRITLDSIGDAVITTDAGGAVTRLNPVAERLTGWDADEATGRPLTEVFDPIDPDTRESRRPVERALNAGEQVEMTDHALLVATDGTERFVADSAAPMVDDGEMVGAVVVFRDVTDEHRRSERQHRQQEALIDLSTDEAIVDGAFERAKRTITEAVAETLSVDRASIWLLDDAGTAMRCVDLYERAADEHSEGTTLTAEEYPNYFDALRDHRAVDATDAQSDPRTAELCDEYLEPLGIASILDATLRAGGDVIGVVCNEHVGDPREWTDDEVKFAAEVSDQVLRALNNRERREQKEKLHREMQFLKGTLDSLDDLFYVLDTEGRLIRWNSRVSEVTGYGDEELTGRTATDFFSADADHVAEAISQVVESRQQVTVETDLVTKHGALERYTFTASPIVDEDELLGISGVGRRVEPAD